MSDLRGRFRERQILGADDLTTEQEFQTAHRRRHNIGSHRWGIVTGLTLTTSTGSPRVEPGMAVDGYGRELLVPEPVPLPPDAFDCLKSEQLDVWLVYGRDPEMTPQRGRWACGPGQENRWREEARLRLTPAAETNPRHHLPDVPDADIPFPPYRTPPDDPRSHGLSTWAGSVVRHHSRPNTRSIRRTGRPPGSWGRPSRLPRGGRRCRWGAREPMTQTGSQSACRPARAASRPR